MNRKTIITIAALFAAGAIAASGCAGPKKINTAGIEPIPVSRLETEGEEIGAKLKAGERLVFKIEEGEKIPLKLSAALPFLEIEVESQEVVFTRDTYVMIGDKGMLISPDRKLWAPIHDTEAIKKLYGASDGSLRIGMSATEEDGASIDVSVGLR